MLLVACLNVGGLLVARAVARERETAVRVAVGAGTWRLVRLWLVEAILLGGAGAAAGLVLARIGLDALTAAAPPGIPRLDAVALDRPVLAAAASCTLFAVAIAALAPLGVARRRDLIGGMRAGASGGPARTLARGVLTVAQCAGAATLVVLAVMLTRSFMKLTTLDLGWDPDGAISMWASPPTPPELRRPWALIVDWSDRAIARLEATPGLRRAAITSQIPLSPQSHPATLARGRRQDGDATRWAGVQHSVTDGYFEAMGIRLVDGRVFDARDRFTAAQLVGAAPRPERGVAVVSATAARLLWPDRPAVGQVLWLPDIDNVTARDVIGVIEDIHFYAVGESPVAHVFVPWTQFPTGSPRVVVRGDGTGASLAPVVRGVLQAVEPGTRIDQVVALDALAARATAQPRFTSRIVALFGTLALLLAGVGIHGTLAYLIRARARDIGIRLALGASQRDILSRTLAAGLVPASIGLAGGLALAFALARTFRALFFGVEPLDAGSLASGAVLLLAVAVAAALGPALAASRVDPATTLRAE